MSSLLGAIEREAREQGICTYTGRMHHRTVHRWRLRVGVESCEAWDTGNDRRHTLPPTLAALWLLARVTPHSVKLGTCEACAARGDGRVWSGTLAPVYHRESFAEEEASACDRFWAARKHEVIRTKDGGWQLGVYSPCKACDATGEDIRTIAQLLLDARPAKVAHNADAWGNVGQAMASVRGVRFVQDPAAVEALVVEADRLQAVGDPLGIALALHLAGRLEARHLCEIETCSVVCFPNDRNWIHVHQHELPLKGWELRSASPEGVELYARTSLAFNLAALK